MLVSEMETPDESDDEASSIPSGNIVCCTSMMDRKGNMIERIDDHRACLIEMMTMLIDEGKGEVCLRRSMPFVS